MIVESQLDIEAEDGRPFHGYLATPEAPSPFAAIVLVQEIFGINENMRWTARRYAQAGFLVCVPDLFWRIAPGAELDPSDSQQRSRAMELNGQFNAADGLSDCRRTVAALRAYAGSNGKVAAVGYCLGGRLAFLLATKGSVDASVCFYPVAVQPELKALRNGPVPLLVHLAAEDPLCKPDAQAEIAAFVRAQNESSAEIYEGVGHGFARLGRSGAAASAADIAESKSIEFLRRHLA